MNLKKGATIGINHSSLIMLFSFLLICGFVRATDFMTKVLLTSQIINTKTHCFAGRNCSDIAVKSKSEVIDRKVS